MSTDKLTPQQRHDARLVLEGKIPDRSACIHCGGVHLRACRRVRRAKYHVDGTLLEVWYWPDGKWDEDEIVWPEDAYDDTVETEEEETSEDSLAQQLPLE